MNSSSPFLPKTALRFAVAHFFTIFLLSNAFRLFVWSQHQPIPFSSTVYGFVYGWAFDLAVFVYSLLPFALLLIFGPQRFWRKKAITVFLTADVFFFLFVLIAEFCFYDEFKDRFNFIAVDYLVYTHEVLQNIWESYPVLPVVCGLGLLSYVLARTTSKWVLKDDLSVSFSQRLLLLSFYGFIFSILTLALNEQRFLKYADFQEEILAKNGMHALFAAYRNNEINFDRFYTTMSPDKAYSYVYNDLKTGYVSNLQPDLEDSTSIVRNIKEPRPMIRKNVVLVVMESMSARFMGVYGNSQNLTPSLDKMAREGLFFDRVYATGTRTVRGLEALALSIPPTPGQSIVRRPAGIGIFNLGSVFKEMDYDVSFIYGGRAMFDNMGAFFSGNGFQVHDQSSFPSDQIGFTNAWGVSDEDLFQQVIAISDESFKSGKNFFHMILNTTNHRPYTYPEGRVSIPSGTGRNGAVQYSDYAIGKFVEEARKKPWFDDTLFIFVADHNAAVAGRSKVDPNDYLIPLIFYGPKIVKTAVNHNMGSQIDVAPTLLEILQASYQSRFFGKELNIENPRRAFLGTYQSVGYLDEKSLTVLSPVKKVEEYSWDGNNVRLDQVSTFEQFPDNPKPSLLATVSYYKTASDWFSRRLLDGKLKISNDINRRN